MTVTIVVVGFAGFFFPCNVSSVQKVIIIVFYSTVIADFVFWRSVIPSITELFIKNHIAMVIRKQCEGRKVLSQSGPE